MSGRTAGGPAVTLYRSHSTSEEADELRALLAATGHPFAERNVSEDPEHRSRLIKAFGGRLGFPGIQVGDQFVPLDRGDVALPRTRRGDDDNHHWLVELLAGDRGDAEEDERSCGSRSSGSHGRRPAPPPAAAASSPEGRPRQTPRAVPPSIRPPRSVEGSPTPRHERAPSLGSNYTGTSELSSASSAFRNVYLPDGTVVPPVEITRKLLPVIQHSVLQANGKQWYYLRGQHAIDVLAKIFFPNQHEECNEADVIGFAQQLIDRSIFVNWTPECTDFRTTFLVMYHYCQPFVLNTLIKWPADERADDDPMSVILRLSRDMDEICIWENYRRKDKVFVALYKSLEEKICQLQVVSFPHEPVEQVTFALNLFNLIIRHAMIMAPKRHWRWPSSLEEFDAFTHLVGYDVGGEIVTLAFLRESLHGTKGQEPVPLVACRPSFLERFSCRSAPMQLRDLHYEGPVVRTDYRVIFATTWGCYSSPTATTVYPYQLSEGLRTAAEMYCQQHVRVVGHRILLPALLSWFRTDFGGAPDAVVKSISRFLSPDQLARVVDLTRRGVRMEVVFDDTFDWQPGVAAPNQQIEFQFASKDVPAPTLPAFACEGSTVAGQSRASRGSLVTRLSRIVPSIPLLGRQSSDGESEVKPRRRPPQSTVTDARAETECDESLGEDEDDDEDDCYDDDDDDATRYEDDDATHGRDTIVSALTLGSEFGDINFEAERQLRRNYQRLAAPPRGGGGANDLGYGFGAVGGLY